MTMVTIIIGVLSSVYKADIDKFGFINWILDQPFYYWVFAVLFYVALMAAALVIRNYYEKKRRDYLLSLLEDVKAPFLEHHLLTRDYMLFLRNFIRRVRELEKEKVDYCDYQKTLKKIDAITELRL